MKKVIKLGRVQYKKHKLTEANIAKDPFKQFAIWFKDAIKNTIVEPNIMNLATVSASGKPSSRILLLRDFSSEGFVFYTNYNSRKAKEIDKNNWACINFFWQSLERQVRIEGSLGYVSSKESDEYFASRPRESQIGAWASMQSTVLKSRLELENKFSFYEKKFHNKKIPRPPYWGGYCLKPLSIEFWQGGENRLHDRIVYIRKTVKSSLWTISRLSP